MKRIFERLLSVLTVLALAGSMAAVCAAEDAEGAQGSLPALTVSGRGFQSGEEPVFLLGANLSDAAGADVSEAVHEMAECGINAVRVTCDLTAGSGAAASRIKTVSDAAKAAGLYTIPVLVPHSAEAGKLDMDRASAELAEIAAALAGEPAVAYFELSFDGVDSSLVGTEQIWRNTVIQMVEAVKAADPGRLCLMSSMDGGINNASKNVVWLASSFCDGISFDAQKASETAGLSSYDAFYLPLLSANYPVAAACGKDEAAMDAGELERFLLESYANGVRTVTINFSQAAADVCRRVAKLFQQAGVTGGQVEAGMLQSTYSVDAPQGVNQSVDQAAVLFQKLHLRPVMYQSDLRFVDTGFSQTSEGTETVSDVVLSVRYKGVIADSREINREVVNTLKSNQIPVLECGDVSLLTERQAADFLEACGVEMDSRTDEGVTYFRTEGGLVAFGTPQRDTATHIYPILESQTLFQLLDESGTLVFEGSSGELAEQGIPYGGTPAAYRLIPLEEEAPETREAPGAFAAFVNGTRIKAPVKVLDGTRYFPLREAAEQLGAEVAWDSAAGCAVVVCQGRETRITPGEAEYISGGTVCRAQAPALLPDETLLVPADMLGGVFGLRYTYDPLTNSLFFA